MRRKPTTPITSGSSAGVGSGVIPCRLLDVATPGPALAADAPEPPGAATPEYVAGSFSPAQCPIGQATAKARPTTRFSGTVPSPASLRWKRESAELDRWSPITKSRFGGTLTVNLISDGGLPGWM